MAKLGRSVVGTWPTAAGTTASSVWNAAKYSGPRGLFGGASLAHVGSTQRNTSGGVQPPTRLGVLPQTTHEVLGFPDSPDSMIFVNIRGNESGQPGHWPHFHKTNWCLYRGGSPGYKWVSARIFGLSPPKTPVGGRQG